MLTGPRFRAACVALAAVSGCSDGSETSSSRALSVEAPKAPAGEPSMPNVAVVPGDVPRVAFLGDDIAAGRYLAAEQAFPSILQRRLRGRGAGFQLINTSVSGDTTADGLRRVDRVIEKRPAVVVIELGANDVSEGVAVEVIEANLRAIVTKLRAAKVRLLLLGVSGSGSHTRDVEAMYARLAAESGVELVAEFMQGVTGHRELTLPDGIQPTPEGHERIAGNLAEPLRMLIQE